MRTNYFLDKIVQIFRKLYKFDLKYNEFDGFAQIW